MADGCVVVVGATGGLGLAVARHYADAGQRVVIAGRDAARVADTIASMGGDTTGAVFDLCEPHGIAVALRDVGLVRHLVLAAIDRDENSVRHYDIDRAIRLTTLKLVGYTEVVHSLVDRLMSDASILVFGGLAKDRPYPGSTTVSTVNGGVLGMVRAMAHELAPIRVNSLHPGITADTSYWAGKAEALERTRARTLTGRNVLTPDIVDAARFLLENPSVDGVDLWVDGGWIIN